MADKTYTEREKVLAEREAFEIGVMAAHADHIQCGKGRADVGLYVYDGHPYLSCDKLPGITRGRYPLPKVTRPRVLTLQRNENCDVFHYRIADGQLQWCDGEHEPSDWVPCNVMTGDCSPEFFITIGQLAANPTEEVEAES